MRWNARQYHRIICKSTCKNFLLVEIPCPKCNYSHNHVLTKREYKMWVANNEKIQDIFPNADKEYREFLISGLCKDCQKEVFESE